jgi:DNA repair protein RecN (Recombination protein N)
MLKTLRIRHLAVIENLTVEFGEGLNLLTGETGAGKSIVVDALGLASGDRADASLVRSGAGRAVVEAAFEFPPRSPVRSLLAERGVEIEEGELVVRREVAAAGGGRVLLNGSPASLGVLREAGDLLVELHGQHEHQSLLRPDRQLELLDQYAGHEELVGLVERAFGSVGIARQRLAELEALAAERRARLERLEAEIRDIDGIAPAPGEYDDLDRERRILRNSGKVTELLEDAVGALYEGEPSASSLAAHAARRTVELADLDSSLGGLASRLDAARLELEDAAQTLRAYRDGADFDPSRLERVEARRAALERLRLRYGADEEAVLRHRDEAAADAARLRGLEDETARAREALVATEEAYARDASALSRARRSAASRLAPAVEEQLRALALEKASFAASFSPSRGEPAAGPEGPPLSPRGAERVEFLLAANPGEAPRPLAKVASGGELSRIMLALHVVLEGAGRGRVLVFDEVDAGVGGAVADAVGARLAALARRHQVLCVTHLPQVAAHASRHFRVRKRLAGGRATTGVDLLDTDARVEELARMLGGRAVTPASRRNAQELLAAAAGTSRRRA